MAFGADPGLRAVERDVIIVAGQSNALNWHAAAAQLPASPQDARILFWYETGAPPERAAAKPINATSGAQWTRLQGQRQEPFVRSEREFFGPEMTLARRLAGPGRPLAVIILAYFGTTLARDWHPDATDGNQLYGRLQREVSAALAGLLAAGVMALGERMADAWRRLTSNVSLHE